MRKSVKNSSSDNSVARTTIKCASAFALALLIGCATPPSTHDKEAFAAFKEANDPLEPMNRQIFKFNQVFDQVLFRPLAELYRDTMPEVIRDGIRNVFSNLDTPSIFIHDVLQGEKERAADSLERFAINSFIGIGGIIDIAANENSNDPDSGIPYHNEDFGQTMAVWGIEPGPYLMLPFLGPSNFRDGMGKGLSFLTNPINLIIPNEYRTGFSAGSKLMRGIDIRSRNIETFDEIERGSIDFYATVRSLYRQFRASEIANGRGPKNPLPEMSQELEENTNSDRVSSVK